MIMKKQFIAKQTEGKLDHNKDNLKYHFLCVLLSFYIKISVILSTLKSLLYNLELSRAECSKDCSNVISSLKFFRIVES